MLPTVHYNMGGIPTNYRGQVRCALSLLLCLASQHAVKPCALHGIQLHFVAACTASARIVLLQQPTAHCLPLAQTPHTLHNAQPLLLQPALLLPAE